MAMTTQVRLVVSPKFGATKSVALPLSPCEVAASLDAYPSLSSPIRCLRIGCYGKEPMAFQRGTPLRKGDGLCWRLSPHGITRDAG